MIKETLAVILAGGLVTTLSAQIVNPQPTVKPPLIVTPTPKPTPVKKGVYPSVTTQTATLQILKGQTNAVFTVSGSHATRCQWLLNGVTIPKATKSTYTVKNVQDSDVGYYQALLSNANGSTPSSSALLNVGTITNDVMVSVTNVVLVTNIVFLNTNTMPDTNGLVSLWRGEGNGDDTMGLNPGTLQGGADFAPGVAGQAFSFPSNGFDGNSYWYGNYWGDYGTYYGNQYVRISNSPSLNPNGSFSISAWVYTTQAGCFQSILGKWAGSSDYPDMRSYLLVLWPDNTVALDLADTSDAHQWDYSYYNFHTSNSIPMNQWVHVTGTYDVNTGTRKIYEAV